MKYGTVTLAEIESLLTTLGGEHRMRAILAGQMVITTSWKECWKRVRLGTHPSAESLRTALEAAGYSCEQCMDGMLMSNPRSVDLALVRVSDLSLPRGVRTQQIYEAARQIGLTYCPEETAAQLLLQGVPSLEDVRAEMLYLFMATDPLALGGYGCRIGRHRGKLYLGQFTNKDDCRWEGQELFVFVRE